MSEIGFLTYPIPLKWMEKDYKNILLLLNLDQFKKYTILSQNYRLT